MKIHCPESNLSALVFRNLISSYELVDNPKDADLRIDLGRPFMSSWLELNKEKAYTFFKDIGVDVPFTEIGAKKLNEYKLPFVVKMICPSTLGTQTIVVKSKEDYSMLKLALNVHGNQRILIQQYVEGREFTVTVLVGEQNWIHVGVAKDYKRLYDGDEGVNTFGMGSISPVKSHPKVDEVIDKVIRGLKAIGQPYKGFLSFQFIEDENLWLLECNTRLCMPEFQSMAKRLDESIFDQLMLCYSGERMQPLNIKEVNAVTVNVVHEGFPYGTPIDVQFAEDKFEIIIDKTDGKWSNNTFIAGVSNFGVESPSDLVQEIYHYLDSLSLNQCVYRKDIASLAQR